MDVGAYQACYGFRVWCAVRARALVLGALFGLAGALFGSHAPAAEPVRFRYEAPAACPTEADFTERVRARLSLLVVAGPGELARHFAVTLALDAQGALGRLEFVDADGVTVSRAVRGENCDEVASGLALVTALAIDPAPSSPDRPAPPLAAPAAARAPSISPPPRPVSQASSGRPSTSVGLGVGYVGWAGPSGGLSLDAFFAAAWRGAGPSLRVSAWHWRASGDSEGRAADFLGWGARLEGCPYVGKLKSLELEPCLATNLGLFRGEGRESASVVHGETANVFWRDVLVVGRARLLIGRLFLLEAQGELAFPLLRQDFGFEDAAGTPAGTIFSIPAVSGGAELHAGVRFP